jgi:hypothetical protein
MELRGSLRINWHLTAWCNYSCQYCPVMIFHQRSAKRERQQHSFDHYPVSRWLEALDGFDYPDVQLKISGGEPFMDRQNLRELLIGLSQRRHITVGLDTNGFWDPAYFADVDKSRIWLNIGFHPSQTTFEKFYPNLLRIREGGFHVAMINFVLAPENIEEFPNAIEQIEKLGIFVNVSTLIPTGIYSSRTQREERELDIIEQYNLPIDNYFKLVKPVTKGQMCYYPAMTYYMMYDGSIRVACLDGTARNIFTDGIPPIPRQAVACEYQNCVGCVDMYRGLVDNPRYGKPVGMFTQQNYAEEVREYRSAGKPKPYLREWLKEVPPKPLFPELLPADAIAGPAVVGAIDQPEIQARSRDRISISGWAASRRRNAPVEAVQITVDGHELGILRHFSPRPDSQYPGWSGLLFLPALKIGDHQLTVRGMNAAGDVANLATSVVRITD